MLGQKLGEEHGKVTGRRVLPGDDFRYVKMEITFETEGTLLGVPGTNIGTYQIFERVEGQIYGEGQGIFMTSEGEGAIWKGHGVGRFDETGVMAIAASIAYQTNSAKLISLNHCLCVVEHRAGMDGSANSEIWEWTA